MGIAASMQVQASADVQKQLPPQAGEIVERLSQAGERWRLFPTNELQAVTRIESSLIKGARRYFERQGFHEIVVPHITRATGACENIDTLFQLDFFGERGFLVQTGQLYLESLIPGIEKVYCVGPSFRAEPDVDARHLCEFPLLEIEFAGNFQKLLTHIENTIYSMVRTVLEERQTELALLGVERKRLEDTRVPFQKIAYKKAVDLLELEFGADLKSAHEKKLVEMHENKPLLVTHYPRAIKFFNMRTNAEDPSVVNSADLLLPYGGEAVGSAEREFEYEVLYEKLKNSEMLKKLEARGGSIKDFDWYLNHLRENGSVQHSGCGIGLNRVTQFILGWNDIRACTGFPLNRAMLM